jgi:hypothetical protein
MLLEFVGFTLLFFYYWKNLRNDGFLRLGRVWNNGFLRYKPGCAKINFMHFINNNIKLIYAYNANLKYFKFLLKISQIVENMNYLYV